ncbi:MAG: hypothetical protein NVSMB60_11530 [Mycobacterium sp.]
MAAGSALALVDDAAVLDADDDVSLLLEHAEIPSTASAAMLAAAIVLLSTMFIIEVLTLWSWETADAAACQT